MYIPKTLFATMVKNARMDLHWTQEELAEKLGVSSKAMRILNLSADDYVYPNGNTNNTTYKQLLRLLTHCDEHQLQVLLATATALLQLAPDSGNNPTE